MIFVKGRMERRPAGARFELVLRGKERQPAEAAGVGAVLFVVEQSSAEWRFGALVEQNAVFFFIQICREALNVLGVEGSDVVS